MYGTYSNCPSFPHGAVPKVHSELEHCKCAPEDDGKGRGGKEKEKEKDFCPESARILAVKG